MSPHIPGLLRVKVILASSKHTCIDLLGMVRPQGMLVHSADGFHWHTAGS